MKKWVLFIFALGFNILLSCYSKDDKNEAEPYPNTDTNRAMEHINTPDSVSPGVSSPNGDIH
jgi:hypothetical protein